MTETIASLPPGIVLIAGALLVPLLPRWVKRPWLVALPLLSLGHLLLIPEGTVVHLSFMDLELTPVRVDGLSLVWGWIFHLAALLNAIYALHVRDDAEHVAAAVYEGGAIMAVFAGDLISLFVGWELTAIASVFLVWARRTPSASRAGMRYLVVQVGSGVLLMAGALMSYAGTGSLAFGALSLGEPGAWPIFLAFGIKAAFPLLHAWLKDAYPEATGTGAVVLSAFTTKLAVYALARGFAGTELLIVIGAVMAVFPIAYAAIENDLRRVLAYALNSQLGFMVVGVGVGSSLAINGVAAHAVCHILYKSLLFMTMGAVLDRAGTVQGSRLGGLYRSMPWTTAFCCIASLSSLPLLSVFVSKSLILSATAEAHHDAAYFVLLAAAAGVFLFSGIKVPWAAFFARDAGIRCSEARWNMLLAMGVAAALCVAIGVVPGALYSLLPDPPDYEPYTATHVVTQLQLLLLAAVCFGVLQRSGLYTVERPGTNLDVDWLYRRPLPAAAAWSLRATRRLRADAWAALGEAGRRPAERLREARTPSGLLGGSWQTGTTVLWVAVLLCAFLLLYYL